MANELTISASLSFTKSGVALTHTESGLRFDVADTNYLKTIQAVGTSEEAMLLPADVGTGGYVLLKNLDTTNYITVRPATGAADLIKLKAGDVALFRLVAAAPFVLANTSSCDLLIVMLPA